MTGPVAARLPDGRLHLQHGPIDLLIMAEGPARGPALAAAMARFASVLDELVAELPLLRTPAGPACRTPAGTIARQMLAAVQPHATGQAGGGPPVFVTPMAAVAGAVADEILAVLRGAGPLWRAAVNNGGDLAVHLAPGRHLDLALADHAGRILGRVTLRGGDGIGGIATSGRHGRSFSLGIADSVTVLAATGAAADAAATLIANAVDLPGHPAVRRRPAVELAPDSDLGTRLVVTGCAPLEAAERRRALDRGLAAARRMHRAGLIAAAHLHLQGQTLTWPPAPPSTFPARAPDPRARPLTGPLARPAAEPAAGGPSPGTIRPAGPP